MIDMQLQDASKGAPVEPSSDQPNASEIIKKANDLKRAYYSKIQGNDQPIPPAPPMPEAPPPPPPNPAEE